MIKRISRAVAISSVVLASASSLEAAAIRVGATTLVYTARSRGSAVAYDSIHHVYLVVSTYGMLFGRFVDANGNPIGSTFTVQSSGNFTHFPSVAFSPDADGGAGAFLVSWHESDLAGGNTSVHGRMVGYARNGAYGADTVLATDGSWWESHVAVAYATVSKEFLVVYPRVHAATGYGIRAVRVNTSAAAIAPAFTVAANVEYEDNPAVTYNPVTNQFLVSYSGFSGTGGFAYIDARLVQAGSGALVGTAATRLAVTVGTWITDATYNPRTNQFLVAWYGASRTTTAIYGHLLAADGSLVGDVITISTRWKANDGLGLAYNTLSNTSFMVSMSSTSVENGGVEVTGAGNPVDNGFQVTAAGGTGNFYPRIATSSDAPNWLVSTANSFTSTLVQMVGGTADGTSPPPSPAPSPNPTPTPAAPTPNPKMNVDYPAANSTVAANAFLVSGWAIDQGSPSGTGVDVVQVWAYPAGSTNAIFVGTATYGVARPDVAGYVGAQFTNCGYTLVGSVPAAGAYDVYVFAHSTLTGTFTAFPAVRINAAGSTSNPKMWVDTPAANATTSQNVTVKGWAIDLGSASGTGVDAVHVWALPTSGAPAVMVGIAQIGDSRGDIAAFAGASRFTPSGFAVTGTIPPGDYILRAYAHSTVTNTFNNAVDVPIRVQ